MRRNTMNKTCLIISGGEYSVPKSIDRIQEDADYIIACDRGYEYAEKMGIQPDCIVGDFDSAASVPAGVIQGADVVIFSEEKEDKIAADAAEKNTGFDVINPAENSDTSDFVHLKESSGALVEKLPAEKDDTDTMYAVKKALAEGYSDITILCAFGGRLDHSIANIQTAKFIASHGCRASLYGKDTALFAVKDGEITIKSQDAGRISTDAAAMGKDAAADNAATTDDDATMYNAAAKDETITSDLDITDGDDIPSDAKIPAYNSNRIISASEQQNVHCTEYISVFSLSDISKGVTIEGAKYEIKDAVLTNDFPIGVSNERTNRTSSDFKASVEDGILAVSVVYERIENEITRQI